jgi:hypothetical protein
MQFKTVIWAVAIMASFWIALGPLIENGWAKMTWRQEPCWVPEDGKRFFYEIDGQRYNSTHINFWTKIYSTDIVAGDAFNSSTTSHERPNDVCWVSRYDPKAAVLRLDAASHMDEGVTRYGAAALLICAVGILTFFAKRKPMQ